MQMINNSKMDTENFFSLFFLVSLPVLTATLFSIFLHPDYYRVLIGYYKNPRDMKFIKLNVNNNLIQVSAIIT